MNVHLALTKSHWAISNDGCSIEHIIKKRQDKQQLYHNVIDKYRTEWKNGRNDWYKACYERYYSDNNFDSCPTLQFLVESKTPLVIGHGGTSVLETSLTLHRIYGVPYLPATSLKGLAAHYAHNILGETHSALRREGEDYKVLFGTQQSAGFIQFHDALVTPDTAQEALKLDVFTPHHQDYNGIVIAEVQFNKTYPAPRDDDSPVPIPFLTANGQFQIALACEGETELANEWLSLAKDILSKALANEGIGAKTNVGYGRMV
ncbi:type III-B CRISPR module RAMP protein Cmr6 [Paenibacillus amylolyticus]|uniref:Type III-B CRISPR module RAMP protein Cmr6 n=1 Tax=Paenibacillus amylolyticus TaxID=1451 RepID=A0ABD8B2H5_PAEAM